MPGRNSKGLHALDRSFTQQPPVNQPDPLKEFFVEKKITK